MTPKPHRPPRQRGINPTPAAGADLYLPTGVLPEEAFRAIGHLRQEARDEIDRLLAFLDATEGDADLEPSLGFPEVDPGRLAPSDRGAADDREEDADNEEDAAGVRASRRVRQ